MTNKTPKPPKKPAKAADDALFARPGVPKPKKVLDGRPYAPATAMSDALAAFWGRPTDRPAPLVRGIGIAADVFAPAGCRQISNTCVPTCVRSNSSEMCSL